MGSESQRVGEIHEACESLRISPEEMRDVRRKAMARRFWQSLAAAVAVVVSFACGAVVYGAASSSSETYPLAFAPPLAMTMIARSKRLLVLTALGCTLAFIAGFAAAKLVDAGTPEPTPYYGVYSR